MNLLRVAFIGGLTNGKIVYDYLSTNKHVDLVLVITYGDDAKVPRHVEFPEGSIMRKGGEAKDYLYELKNLDLDLILVAGWSGLLSDDIIKLPKLGTIGFHPSKLPNDRGRSVIAWQIEEGYTETGLTMFYYSDIPDGGDIIATELVKIEANDYVSDILAKMDFATNCLIRSYFALIRQGKAPRKTQSINDGNFRRLRTEHDSIIDWNSNMLNIYNKVRAIAPPYPCAITFVDGKKVRVNRAEIVPDVSIRFDQLPNIGQQVAIFWDKSVLFRCKDGFVRIFYENVIQ
jgi:methionyl-tRNA formyltransferase